MKNSGMAINFNSKAHGIRYAVSISSDQKNIILEGIPLPSDPLFRYTYIKTGDASLEACFEMTPSNQPGSNFMVIKSRAKRISTK
jgi:hypothetical protein